MRSEKPLRMTKTTLQTRTKESSDRLAAMARAREGPVGCSRCD